MADEGFAAPPNERARYSGSIANVSFGRFSAPPRDHE
jgi:hypothetical protein